MDIETPTPPDLTNRGVPARIDAAVSTTEVDLRRPDLEAVLAEGAWQEGVDEWAQYTDLDEADVALAEEMGLVRALDFYWDVQAERLRYVAPEVPEAWSQRAPPKGAARLTVQAELDDLGRIVAETIATDYVGSGDGEGEDLVWGVDSFGQAPT